MASGNPNDEAGGGPQSPTALLPNNAFGGKTPEVGSVCKFRVVQVYDDQAEVEYAGHDESDEPEAEPGAPEETGEGEMTGYLE